MSAKVGYFVTNYANYLPFYALQTEILRNDESEPLFFTHCKPFFGQLKDRCGELW
jgi:hypothetical protein